MVFSLAVSNHSIFSRKMDRHRYDGDTDGDGSGVHFNSVNRQGFPWKTIGFDLRDTDAFFLWAVYDLCLN